ncbi:uncharacterized protein BO95DRAFT_272092 [Aspergillus brunneoviolaceus CBS 621.78]|uniref:Uncharacterized protein n=1 Tax=Aspergillus brunneoviolaceus CBS 621.78 TaxID=1450534 RepID=A0ACD1FWI4_9EURO|nr:hypothetical protein BO95DRAFT_272092 [Aspergillus brunneoviolaceus CBS 621.78]RAH41366.1 hypothetical protein BO95DRAFT_272092 [Aspergillus brunneoviolaceus CBS 621.78]
MRPPSPPLKVHVMTWGRRGKDRMLFWRSSLSTVSYMFYCTVPNQQPFFLWVVAACSIRCFSLLFYFFFCD